MNQTSREQQGKWYPPRPNYTAPQPPSPGYYVAGARQVPGIPVGTPPQAAFSQTLATVKAAGFKFSVTAALLFGGFVVAAIALFLPWVTVSATSPLGGNMYQIDASPFKGGWIFLLLLVIGGAAWLAWPVVSGSKMAIPRLAGLSVVVGLQILCLFVGFADYAGGVSEKDKAVSGAGALAGIVPDVSMDAGMFLYAAAVVAIAVGLVRVWTHRSKAA
jgi:hypothetical protein